MPAPVGGGSPSAKAIYDALRAQRRELVNQADDVQSQREEVASQLRQPNLSDADKAGLQQRLVTLDLRLVALDLQKAEADAAVAKQSAIPGSIMPDPPRPRQGPPEEVFVLTGIFFFVVLFPLTIAYARRIWRRGAPTALPQEIYDRFTRLEQSLDTIAIEVERVGEGQRFLTRMQAQQSDRALGAGPAERVEAGSREREGHLRK
ncbi:MAG: hypothetical protein AABZ80_02475 [Gemmatimonadota bacterium]